VNDYADGIAGFYREICLSGDPEPSDKKLLLIPVETHIEAIATAADTVLCYDNTLRLDRLMFVESSIQNREQYRQDNRKN